MARQNKDDVRRKPSLDPNPHYFADQIFNNIFVIIAFIIVFSIIMGIIFCGDIAKDAMEILKAILFMAAGYLFSSKTKK